MDAQQRRTWSPPGSSPSRSAPGQHTVVFQYVPYSHYGLLLGDRCDHPAAPRIRSPDLAQEAPADVRAPDVTARSGDAMKRLLEVSILMPCLNEAETIGRCVDRARESITRLDVRGEVLVADNGSTDGSQEIALAHGARVVAGRRARVRRRHPRRRCCVSSGATSSWATPTRAMTSARYRRSSNGCVQGDDLVMGNRFAGGIDKGAMPWSHRWIGNPVLSMTGRIFFSSRIRDFHCGLRGFSVDAFRRMRLNTTGMEFASEIVVKASLASMKISEVPISLHKDGRSRPPHLRTWRDGWRHLRFLLLFCPRWLFVIPGPCAAPARLAR